MIYRLLIAGSRGTRYKNITYWGCSCHHHHQTVQSNARLEYLDHS